MTNLKDQTDLTSAINSFDEDIECFDDGATIIRKVKEDKGYWLLIKYNSEEEPCWYRETRPSMLTEN
jgi:hypothetical protein